MAGEALVFVASFLVGNGVAGGLENCVVGSSPVPFDTGTAAFKAVDLVVRVIVVCCRSRKARARAGLLSFASKRRWHTCRNQNRMTSVTFTSYMLSS
jgi:hypothetical protein